MKIKYALLLLIFMFIFSNLAQIFAGTWQTFDVSSGLPSSNVTAFSYNSKWMAVGTDKGIALYDNETCEWSIPNNLPEEVASASIKDLTFDENGNLWMATPQGLVHYQKKNVIVYEGKNGLPTIDINRIQVADNKIFVGCFGGFVASAFIPNVGGTSFIPVNYDAGFLNSALKIRSVGISSMGMFDSSKGWFGTKGQGMVNVIGANEYFFNQEKDDLISDWVTDFWIFKDSIRETKMIVAGNGGLSLVKNGSVKKNIKLSNGNSWITAVATLKQNADTVEFLADHEYTQDEIFTAKFLKSRSLFVGTRSSGLWKFRSGIWTQYTSENSSLQSNCINRLYMMGRHLVVLTPKGMAIIPVDSQQYDEFARTGIGNRYAKTIYAMPPCFQLSVPFKQVLKTKDYWFVHKHGLSRFKTNRSVTRINLEDSHFTSGRIEEEEDPSSILLASSKKVVDFPSVTKQTTGTTLHWQIFTNRYFLIPNPEICAKIPSEDITKISANKGSRYIWLIFDDKKIYRMHIETKRIGINNITSTDELPPGSVPFISPDTLIDYPIWEVPADTPWPSGLELTTVWGNNGMIYVGTKGDGYYVLENPEAKNTNEDPFLWQHYGIYDGLCNSTVIGFTRWNTVDDKYLVILHPKKLSLWNNESFSGFSTGAIRRYTCLDSDAIGNLWVGSETGLFRVDKNYKIYSYTITDAKFESNHITAIQVPPAKSSNSLEVFVACDREANFSNLNDNLNGSDQMPLVKVIEVDQYGRDLDDITTDFTNTPGYRDQFQEHRTTLSNILHLNGEDGDDVTDTSSEDDSNVRQRYFKKRVIEADISGASFHYFNGLVWDKWKVAGVRSMLVDGEYVWITSNVRVRRLLIPR